MYSTNIRLDNKLTELVRDYIYVDMIRRTIKYSILFTGSIGEVRVIRVIRAIDYTGPRLGDVARLIAIAASL